MCHLVLIILTADADSVKDSLTLFVPARPADDDRSRDRQTVRSRRAAAPVLGRNAFLVVDRFACRARDIGIVDGRCRIVSREGTPDRSPSRATAAHDRFIPIVGLLKDRGVCAAAYRGRDPLPTVIHDLGADRTGRK